jgi:hypothetical protein
MTNVAEFPATHRSAWNETQDDNQQFREWLEKRLSPLAIEIAMRGYGVPERFRLLEVQADLIPRQAHAWLRLADRGASMILAGRPGSGKSVTAYWCLRELYLSRSRAGRGVPTAAVIKCADLYESVFAKQRRLPDLAESVDALVLDDWGTAYEHAWPLAVLDQIIDRRWEAMKSTIVTTNVHPTEGEKSLATQLPRAYDRLMGDPGPGFVPLDRPSLRRSR